MPDKEPINIDRRKMQFDFMKHLTSICSGSVVVSLAFVANTEALKYSRVLSTAVVLFVGCIALALASMFCVTILLEEQDERLKDVTGVFVLGSFATAFLGFICMAWVIFQNVAQ